jgi:iron complex transport system substrate-binding protein
MAQTGVGANGSRCPKPLCALDAYDRLVAIDRDSDWPHSVQPLPRVAAWSCGHRAHRRGPARPGLVLLHPGSRVAERMRDLGLKC